MEKWLKGLVFKPFSTVQRDTVEGRRWMAQEKA